MFTSKSFFKILQYFVANDGLLNARGYTFEKKRYMIDEEVLACIWNDVDQSFKKKDHHLLTVFDFNIVASLKTPSEASVSQNICVVFCSIIKKDNIFKVLESISLCQQSCAKDQIEHLLLCTKSITSSSLQILRKKYMKVELFKPNMCIIRPEKHLGQPLIQKIKRESLDHFLGDKATSNITLTKIFHHDPLVLFYGFGVNDVLKITRPLNDGKQDEYRVVVCS